MEKIEKEHTVIEQSLVPVFFLDFLHSKLRSPWNLCVYVAIHLQTVGHL